MNRRNRRTSRSLAVEVLEHRRLLVGDIVAVDFHNHFFSHYGETAQNDATAASNWKTQLPSSRRQQDIATILQGASAKTSLLEFVGFSEHAGFLPYNNPTEVRDLESKLTSYLATLTNQSAAFGSSVGIELTPQNGDLEHLGVPFLDVASFSYSSSTGFGLGRLIEVAGLSPLIWNHPAGSNAGVTRSTLQDFRTFMDSKYTPNFRGNATVKGAVAAIEFPKNMNSNFAEDFKFTERAMVAATVDGAGTNGAFNGFWLTPTLGSDSHTQYSFNGSTLKLDAPFTATNPSAQAIKPGVGLLEIDVPTGAKFIPEANAKAALQSRRGSVVYQPSATIRVDGTGGVREGSKVSSLPQTLTVTVAGFPPNSIAKVEAHYVLKNSITASTAIKIGPASDTSNTIKTIETAANATKTAFTFSAANPSNIAFVYFVAYDTTNTPLAITAPTIATAPAVAQPSVALVAAPSVLSKTTGDDPSITRRSITAIANQQLRANVNQPQSTTLSSPTAKTTAVTQSSRIRSYDTAIDHVFEEIGSMSLLEVLVPLL